jgi:similar to stage IV sporulation protein
MFLTIWNYLRGYVIIEVSGFSVERFLNLAIHKGIYLWGIKRNAKGIILNVGIKGFKLLKPCAKKTKCHIKIITKIGLPFVLHKYRKRKILVSGILFFIVILYFLSSFIWTIEITGTNRIDKKDIIDYSVESGLKPGAYKNHMDLRQLEKKFMNNFPDISWISISVKGTKAKIELTETIEKTQIIDRTKPCDLVAAKNGLIISIVTNAGTPKVKVKDVVEKGDLLVSGQLLIGEGAEQKIEYVHASAKIKAKLWYEFDLSENIKYNEKIYTGQTKKGYSINIKDKKINLLKASVSYSNCDKISNVKKLDFGGDFEFPISLVVDEYKEYTLDEKTRTEEQIKKIIGAQIEDLVKNKLDQNVEIVDKNIKYTVLGDKVTAKVIITTIEDINKEVEIGGNTAGGSN